MIEQIHAEYPKTALELRLRTPSRKELKEYYEQLERFERSHRFAYLHLSYPDFHLSRYRERDIDRYFSVVDRDLPYIDKDTYDELCHDNITKLNITLDEKYVLKEGCQLNDWCIKEAVAGENGSIRHYKSYEDLEDDCYIVAGNVRIFYTG